MDYSSEIQSISKFRHPVCACVCVGVCVGGACVSEKFDIPMKTDQPEKGKVPGKAVKSKKGFWV